MDVSAYVKVVLCVHRDSFGTIFVYSEQYPSQYTSQGSLEAKLLFFLMHSLTWQHDLYLKKAHLGAEIPIESVVPLILLSASSHP